MKTKSQRKLKQVIAVRHGTDSGRDLDENGVAQVQRLADAIKRKFVRAGQKVEIFSSPFPRAKQSAQIIAEYLSCGYRVCEVLKRGEFHDGQAMMEALLTARDDGDVLIAVTHYAAPSGIINALSGEFFKRETSCLVSEKGDGCTLCVETGVAAQTLLD